LAEYAGRGLGTNGLTFGKNSGRGGRSDGVKGGVVHSRLQSKRGFESLQGGGSSEGNLGWVRPLRTIAFYWAIKRAERGGGTPYVWFFFKGRLVDTSINGEFDFERGRGPL